MNIISLIALSFITAIMLFIALTIIAYYIDTVRDAIKRRKSGLRKEDE